MLFMGTDKDVVATVHRDNVVLIYKDQVYKMPAIADFRKEYLAERKTKPQPDTCQDQPLFEPDIVACKKFPVEPDHTLMLGPLHKKRTGC